MNEVQLRKLMERLQSGDDISNIEWEEVIIEYLRELGTTLDNDPVRKLYKKFFDKIRLSESKYNSARSNLEKIEEAANIVREALDDLDQHLS